MRAAVYSLGNTFERAVALGADGDGRLLLIRGWARNGLSRGEIAKKMKMSVKRLNAWMREDEEVYRALARDREMVDLAVEEALLEKALKGDVRACSYWLKHRRGGVWAEGRVEAGGGRAVELLEEAGGERTVEGFM